ncbi:MAG: pyrroline-5-carboxylate reductase [Deltaproteobacteria bacterium]|nr:pyrroline-5-carboxylate reductase [Deltaproteobacteria bacterium]MBI3388861.1 pyrroline-5-carboxylate reductase [Deltaproteobacteria bacterium]
MATKRRTKAPARRVIGFIGGGNMATAMIRGLIAAGLYRADEMQASDVDATKRVELKRRLRVTATEDNRAVVHDAKVILLAVKPQIMDEVLAGLRDEVAGNKLFISIAAGVPTARIERGLGPEARVVRVMPNTPALLGKGMSVIVRGARATVADERLAVKLFRAVGRAVAVPDERLIDAVTGLSGSGPAYVYLFAEALIAGGVAAGLPAQLAAELTYQTLHGATAMLQETNETPERLRAQVTSPGGTTLAGLTELDQRGFKEAVAAAVTAATNRSRELGRG